jgi:hypothetical protein
MERLFARIWSTRDVFTDASFVEAKLEMSEKTKITIWGAPGPTLALANQVIIMIPQ